MRIRTLSLALGFDLAMLDDQIAQATSKLQDFGDAQAALALEQMAAPPPAAAAGGGGSGGAAGAAESASSVADAMAPLIAIGARIEAMFDRVGGTIVSLARRLDSEMKLPGITGGLERVQGALQETHPLIARVVGAANGFVKVSSWLGSLGDVAGKSLTQMRGFEGLAFAKPIAGAAKLAGNISGITPVAHAARGAIRAIGTEIAMALGVFSAGFAAIQFFKTAIKGGSDLNETVSAGKEVFKDAYGTVAAQADEMAAKFGLAKREQLDMAMAFGSIAQGAGYARGASAEFSNTFTKLAADFASFRNLSFDEAAQKLRSGLAGESEPLRQYGVMLDENAVKAYALSHGLANSAGEIDNHAKVAARAALIQQSLAAASGDLDRTAGGAANQFRQFGGSLQNLAASIGGALLPAVTPVIQLFNRFAGAAADAFESVKPRLAELAEGAFPALASAAATAADWFGAVWRVGSNLAGLAAGPLSRAVALVADVFHGVVSAGSALAGAAAGPVTGALKLVGDVAGWLGGVLMGVAAAFAKVSDFAFGTKLAESLDAMPSKLAEARQAIAKAFEGGFSGETWGDRVRSFFDEMKLGAAGAASAVSGTATAMDGVGTSVGKAAKEIGELKAKLTAQAEEFGRSGTAAELYKLKAKGASDADLAEVRALDAKLTEMKELKKISEDFDKLVDATVKGALTPEEKYKSKIAELKALHDAGRIDAETFNIASAREYKADLGQSQHRYAGAAEAGSKEAYDALLRFSTQGRDEPIKVVAKIGEKHLTEAQKQTPLLQKMAEYLEGMKTGYTSETYAFAG